MACRFGRTQRLLKTDEFSSVFRLRQQANNAWFQVLSKKNNLEHPRLGLVVGKKIAKRAVARNYMKRCIREVFRQNAAEFCGVDFVVRVRQKFDRRKTAECRASLLTLLRKRNRWHASSSS